MSGLVLSIFPGIDLLIDASDAALVNSGPRWYRCNGYLRRDVWEGGRKRREYMHRIITGASPGQHVDHINGNKMDNRRSNLRIVTRSQNLQNRQGATRHNRSTGTRGVYVDRRDGAIYARLKVGGLVINLGRFEFIADADLAVRAARAERMTHSRESACR